MPTHKYIHQASTVGGGLCDLCTANHAVWVYRTRSEVVRSARDGDQVVDSWTESVWYVCATCGALIEARNRLDLMGRVDKLHLPRRTIKATVKVVASFFQQLEPGRERGEIRV